MFFTNCLVVFIDVIIRSKVTSMPLGGKGYITKSSHVSPMSSVNMHLLFYKCN